jgi:type I restriction enzyme R subunit
VQLKTTGQLALYNNLKDQATISAVQDLSGPLLPADKALDRALQLDSAIKSRRPDGWRGVLAKEQMVKQAMFDVLQDINEVNRLFPIVFAQKEY